MIFLMEIRDNKYVTEDNQVKPEFYDILSDYENRFNDIVAKLNCRIYLIISKLIRLWQMLMNGL